MFHINLNVALEKYLGKLIKLKVVQWMRQVILHSLNGLITQNTCCVYHMLYNSTDIRRNIILYISKILQTNVHYKLNVKRFSHQNVYFG